MLYRRISEPREGDAMMPQAVHGFLPKAETPRRPFRVIGEDVDVVAALRQRARQIEGVKPPMYDDCNFTPCFLSQPVPSCRCRQ